jgi:hypothetical protein
MKSNLLDDLAIRLAATCQTMGLDDADEDLLWRYLMELPSGAHLPSEVAEALNGQSEGTPVAVLSYSWKASFPERFYKPRRKGLAKLGMGLKAGGVCEFNNRPLYVRSLAEYEESLRAEIASTCFQKWFEDITTCIREDGRNWEPPAESDVQIVLKVKKLDLSAKLDMLTESQLM